MNRIILVASSLMAIALLSSCASRPKLFKNVKYIALQKPTKDYRAAGFVEGNDCITEVMGHKFGGNSIGTAMENARFQETSVATNVRKSARDLKKLVKPEDDEIIRTGGLSYMMGIESSNSDTNLLVFKQNCTSLKGRGYL